MLVGVLERGESGVKGVGEVSRGGGVVGNVAVVGKG